MGFENEIKSCCFEESMFNRFTNDIIVVPFLGFIRSLQLNASDVYYCTGHLQIFTESYDRSHQSSLAATLSS